MKLLARFIAAFDTEREDCAGTFWRIFLGDGMIRAVWQRGVFHPFDLRMALQVLSDGKGVLQVPVHAHAECLDSLQEEKRVEGADARPYDRAALRHARFDDEANGAERVPKLHAVISAAQAR
jgi:hypothetical protein